MLYTLRHDTEYTYAQPVTLGHNVVHLRPRPVPLQTLHTCDVHIAPPPAVVRDRHDYFGNPVTFFTLQQPHHTMTVSAVSRVEVHARPPLADGLSRPWELVRDECKADVTDAGLDAYQHSFDSPLASGTAELADYAAPSFPVGRPVLDSAYDLTRRIYRDFRYDPATTTIATPVAEVFRQRSGVCQDFAHLMIACLRSLDLPARYVSGYLQTVPPPGQKRLVGADASHAWVGVYSPGLGWVDFDPTNDKVVGDQHITLAWGRDFNDVSPVRGLILGGGEHKVEVRVDVAAEGSGIGDQGSGPKQAHRIGSI